MTEPTPSPILAQPSSLWRAPRWALAVLLATLGMLGPFAVDTYLPAFAGIARSLDATPLQMQQTLSAYLLGFAVMNLFHGALADSLGRRPVVLVGVALFTLASVGCALSDHIGTLVFFRAVQGMSTGAGIVVSRTVIRDLFPPAEAQRMMSQVTIYFGAAPAVAPIIGGWLFVHLGWRPVFWFLALVGVAIWLGVWRALPETLPKAQRHPLEIRHLMRGYLELGGSRRFWLLALASGVPFNGMFLYVLSAPVYLGELLGLQPTEFFWFFLSSIGGIMVGAWLSGWLAGRMSRRRFHHPHRLDPGECGGQPGLAHHLPLGHPAHHGLQPGLVVAGAGSHAHGAGSVPGPARHGLVAAGHGGQRRQRLRGRCGRAAGNARPGRPGSHVGCLHAGGLCRLAAGQA
jgi:Bcr/CflA subfamily drug resistance transporter